MTRPLRYLARMGVCVVAVILLSIMLSGRLTEAFSHNPALNTGILVVLAFGVFYITWQVVRLFPEIEWIERYRAGESDAAALRRPRLLAPLAVMLEQRKGSRLTLSAQSLRSLLDGINARLDEAHDISRYLVALLVFLGLLGTFWGLLKTISGVAETLSTITVQGDPGQLFEQLKAGLQAPLAGMGTAFSSSLLGLAGSLVLGFLELQATQAHNRFFNQLEEWLAGQTRLSAGGPLGDEQPVPAYIQALLEQTADSLENLQRTMTRGEEARIQANTNVINLVERLGALTDQMRAEQQVMMRLSEDQAGLRPLLARLADLASEGGFGIDEMTRHHIRNLDLQTNRMIEEMSLGRQVTVQELRSEIRLLARTIAAVAEDGER